jgi:fructosamine-3-kinase
MWNQITDRISQATGQSFAGTQRRSISGGSINQAYSLSDGNTTYFIKLNQADRLDMFEAEDLGLRQIANTQTIRVPRSLCCGVAERSAYIVLEWLDLGYGDAWAAMGRNLAAMHQVTSRNGFGWDRDNTIGATLQKNPWMTSWTEFFTEARLGYQFRLAAQRGGRFPQQDRLLAAVPDILAGHAPQPSLVHGDLWSGNAAVTQSGEPVIFDPATYYGDREVDLALSELFGSFPASFYSAYRQAFPLDAGYDRRKTLYNLYHILNHFNLFGGGYEAQANRMIATLL